MDPVTLAIVTGAGLVSTLTAYFIGRRKAPKAAEHRKLREDLQYAKKMAEHEKRRREGQVYDLALLRKQRDDYRKIAETHTVKYPDLPQPVQAQRVWKAKCYRGLPDANLAALAADLEQFANRELSLDLVVRGRGGWKPIIKERWFTTKRVPTRYHGQYEDERTPVDFIGTIHFEGPPERVMEEMTVFLRDNDSGLVTIPKGKKKGQPVQWRDPDSALKFEVTLSVGGPVTPATLPKVHTVEVLRVEENVVERIIEKPIRADPPATATGLCGHTQEEVVGLIEAVLELRAESGGPQEAEFKRLGELVEEAEA